MQFQRELSEFLENVNEYLEFLEFWAEESEFLESASEYLEF